MKMKWKLQKGPAASKVAAAVFALASAVVSVHAEAHGDAKPLHGGIVQVASDVHYELVPAADGASLYVIDHGKPADATKLGGKLTVLTGTKKSEAMLQPAGGNRLQATGVDVASASKVMASVKSADGKTTSVRFQLK